MKVYYTDRTEKTGQKVYHSYETCQHLKLAKTKNTVQQSELGESWSICTRCRGEGDPSTSHLNRHTDASMLENMNPEDVGLSPMGER